MFAFLFAPAVILNLTAIGSAANGITRQSHPNGFDQAGLKCDVRTADAASELRVSEWNSTLAMDDRSLRELRRLSGERPGNSVVIFEEGVTTWRKAAYYAPSLPVIVLENRSLRAGSPPVMSVFQGARHEDYTEGRTPLRVPVPAGARIIWLLNPRTKFYADVSRSFPLTPAGPVYFTDLPGESGSRVVGEYEVAW